MSGADKRKKGVVSKKAAQAQKKTPLELLIVAASTTTASAVDPVTPPAAASTRGRHHALRDVLRSQQVLKANVKDVDLPIFGDSSSDEESEEEDDYPFDKELFEDEKEKILDDDYYHNTEFHGKGSTGHKLTPGGPQKPDTTSMVEVEAEQVLKKWRKERKKYTDGVAL